ncbi:MAG: MtrAB system response regulator MtrA [Propionibacteriaceae bacterium]
MIDGTSRPKILVVDDDPSLAEMLQIVLKSEGYDSVWCGRGDIAFASFKQEKPDLVLLDVMLPGKDGVQICRQIREESGIPIIMLTAKSDTQDIVAGLEAGADDYVVKPFRPKELIARIRTRLRRLTVDEDVLRVGDVEISIAEHIVTRDGEVISLTPLEFDLLVSLARKPKQVFKREQLLEAVWGYRHAADTRLVNVHIQRLRSKIELDPENPVTILTVRGVGYKAGLPCE